MLNIDKGEMQKNMDVGKSIDILPPSAKKRVITYCHHQLIEHLVKFILCAEYLNCNKKAFT